MIREMEDMGWRFLKVALFFTKSLYACFTIDFFYAFGSYALFREPALTNSMFLPLVLYLPSSFTPPSLSFYTYSVMAAVQCLYLYIVYVVVARVYQIGLLPYNNMLIELKLYLISLKDFDDHYFEGLDEMKRMDGYVEMRGDDFGREGIVDYGDVIRVGEFKKYVKRTAKQLVEHHQFIFRKMNQLNEGLRLKIFYVNAYICLQICVAIVSFQHGGSYKKFKYSILTLFVILSCLVYSEYGQQIQNEFENVRHALYETCVIEKPTWLQRSFLILMIRNTTIPQLSLYNTFTINRKNISNVCQAAYSYFNLLNQKKIKDD
ncbi:uncharacterized protein LOC120354031 [Nilaparvata lugens]|nr:uncharacterized protein LOC120354031 [Nilaparvata lugens]